MSTLARCLAAFCLLVCSHTEALGQRAEVLFQHTEPTLSGQSVFVVGSLPELGAWDLRRAVKLESSQYPTWRVRVELPSDRAYSYRFVVRNDGPGELADLFNAIYVTDVIDVVSEPPSPEDPVDPNALKTVVVEGALDRPTLFYRERGVPGPFASIPMIDIGNGAVPGEARWAALEFSLAADGLEFVVLDDAGTLIPAQGTFATPLREVFVRNGEVYETVPPETTTPWTRLSNRTYTSTILGEDRVVRIMLPRNYGVTPGKRYPVLYMHDGQGLFGSGQKWQVDITVPDMIAHGQIREIIVVGIDNTGFDNRFRDYVPDGDSSIYGPGMGSNYAAFIRDELKPQIDAEFLTIPDANVTGSIGSSLGGVCALYHGWQHGDTFKRVGAFSGAWPFSQNFNTILDDPGPSLKGLKVYIDSGDAGLGADNFNITASIRDTLLARSTSIDGFAIAGNLYYTVGFGDEHNEFAWARRLPGALAFLYPATEDAEGLKSMEIVFRGDADRDGVVAPEDLYAHEQDPKDDWDNDGVSGTASDLAVLKQLLRTDELKDLN